MAAVIGPVGVDHLDLGDGGVAVLRAEILLAELDIAKIHGKAVVRNELFQLLFVQLVEALQNLDRGGHGVLHFQGLLGVQRSLAGLHRVDDVFLDLGYLLVGQGAFQQIDAGRAHQRALALTDELDALSSGVGALVELAGQILHCKGHAVAGGQLGIGVIHRRLTEHGVCIRAESFPYRLLQMLRTTVLVIIGELFFRANGLRAGMQMFRTMVTGFAFPVFDDALFKALGIDKFDLMIVAVTLLIVFVVSVINEKGKSVRALLAQRPAAVRWTVFYALILFIIVFGAYGKGYIPVDPMYANF